MDDDNLTLDRIMEIFTADLCHRSVEFQVPPDPLTDTSWILQMQKIYAPPTQHRGHETKAEHGGEQRGQTKLCTRMSPIKCETKDFL
ncbi:MAG: hypothetical protein DMG32_16110 [Acidobacteria bacterium]|nr:MAG: hypothetical protein DMG32_16110 [Acidobacteriota bacterium]